jgi:arylsulfatase A-like enzyme
MGFVAILLAVMALLGWRGAKAQFGQAPGDMAVLPHPEPTFDGKIGRTVKESTPDFPKEVQAPAGAPNVLLILLNGVKLKPLDGVSLVYTFDDARAPTRHPTQYFEMMANRGIYHDGWMASTTPLRLPWINFGTSPSPDDFKWEFYHVAEDFSQANNLAANNPAKLKELQGVFDAEARKYNVYPLDSLMAERSVNRRAVT